LDTDLLLEEEKDDIYLLQFSRNPEKFETLLAEGMPLKSCRDALEEAGWQWSLQSGAKVFVHPWQYEQTLEFLESLEKPLRPYHVVVTASVQHLVEESLSGMPCRQGARIKKRIALGSAQSGKRVKPNDKEFSDHAKEKEGSNTSEHDEEACELSQDAVELPMVVCAQRTFICCLPRFPRLRDANSVTQSTTAAHGGINPRRVMGISLSSD